MADKEDLRAAIDRVYRASIVETRRRGHGRLLRPTPTPRRSSVDESTRARSSGSSTRCWSQAIADHASDLHIEPCSTHIAIRMRIDGVLHDSSTVPLELLRPMVSRVKILGGLDIAQNRLAQDGRFSLDDRRAFGRRARRDHADRRGRGGDAAPARPGP